MHYPAKLALLLTLLHTLRSALRTRAELTLENLALRQQLATLRQSSPRPHLRSCPSGSASLRRRPGAPFSHNHLGSLASIDFFAVPTATFRVLLAFLVLRHDRRRVVHFNITEFPSAAWTAQQIIEAFPRTLRPST